MATSSNSTAKMGRSRRRRLVHAALDAQQAGVRTGAQANLTWLAIKKAHFPQHLAGLDLANFHLALRKLRHQARLPFQHEEQRFTNIADICDDLPSLLGHPVTIIEKIMDLPLSKDARIHQGSQKMGQVLAVLLRDW